MSHVVVVGAGSAGCVVAARLARAGRSVTLVESGPDYGPSRDRWPGELLDATTLPTTHNWGYRGHGAGGQDLEYDRAQVMGGCSSHNGCTQSVGWAGDYDAWGPSWSAALLTDLFAQVAEDMQFRTYKSDEIQPFQSAFLKACGDEGMPIRDDFDDLNAGEGAGCPPVNAVDGIRINASFAYVDPVRQLPGFTIMASTTVNRVLISGHRAVGVEVIREGRRVSVYADEVVLAAGTYGSPAVLQRSGVGDARSLERLGIEVLTHLPGVGQNLHDQPSAQLELVGTALLGDLLGRFAAARWMPEEQAVARLRSPSADGPYDLHVYPWVEPASARPGTWTCIVPVGLLTPRSRGSVSIASADPRVAPLIETNFFSDPGGKDLAAVRFGIRWVQDLLRHPAVASLVETDSAGQDPGADDQTLDHWIRSSHSHYWHPVGTCRMGRQDDPRSVVGFDGRVHGIDSLRVADASLFPDIPRSTTAWPTAVVGERIAAWMLTT